MMGTFDIKVIINNIFNILSMTYKETTTQITINIKINELPSSYDMKRILELIKKRDIIEIIIDFDDEFRKNIELTNRNIEESIKKYEKSIDNLEKDYEIEKQCSIIIKKNIEANKISIYNWEEFTSNILSKNNFEILNDFNFLLKEQKFLNFEVMNKEMNINTKTLSFGNSNQKFITKIERLEILSKVKEEIIINSEIDINLIPDDFIVVSKKQENNFEKKLSELATLLSICFVSNQSIISKEVLKNTIIGQCNANFNTNLNDIRTNNELIMLYEWIYEGENFIEKLVIARNIITLNSKNMELTDIDNKILSSARSNYKIYLKQSVNKFLEAKDVIINSINNTMSEITANVTNLIDNLIKNIYAIFFTLFTIYLSNIFSQSPLENIFTPDVKKIVRAVLIGSIFFLIISVLECIFKFSNIKSNYENIKNGFSDIFPEPDFDNIFNGDRQIKNAEKKFYLRGFIIVITWLISIILAFWFVSKV